MIEGFSLTANFPSVREEIYTESAETIERKNRFGKADLGPRWYKMSVAAKNSRKTNYNCKVAM